MMFPSSSVPLRIESESSSIKSVVVPQTAAMRAAGISASSSEVASRPERSSVDRADNGGDSMTADPVLVGTLTGFLDVEPCCETIDEGPVPISALPPEEILSLSLLLRFEPWSFNEDNRFNSARTPGNFFSSAFKTETVASLELAPSPT
jgi:hypothetical protein